MIKEESKSDQRPLYVRMKPKGQAKRTQIIDAKNGTVAIDFDEHDEILGVEILDGWIR